MKLSDFSTFSHQADKINHKIYYLKNDGPPIIIIHELPGMNPECLAFAKRLFDKGFSVYLPLLFGKAGKKSSKFLTYRYLARVCISREFYVFQRRKTSPVVSWLRSLCRKLHQEYGGKGVGAIGMCLTGGFAIPMMVEPSLMAPVISQASLPIGIRKKSKYDLGCSDEDLSIAKKRAKEGITIKAFRFDQDKIAPKEKMETYQNEFGSALEYHCLKSDQQGNKGCHAVFTLDYFDDEGHPTREAFEELHRFFKVKLN